ncbi:MAG: DHH family phosphoesterase [Lachnospiraceae bacterium]|nr:DHH family phosphoesterase [Lachnospiraceae bacterium]
MKIKGKLKSYLIVSILLGVLLLALDVWMYQVNLQCGIIISVFAVIYFVATAVAFWLNKPGLMKELVSFATEYGQIQKELLRELELPHAVLDDTGRVLWANNAFENLCGQDQTYNKNIANLFPEITTEVMPAEMEPVQVEVLFGESCYDVVLKKVALREIAMYASDTQEKMDGYLVAAYFFDKTALTVALRELDNQSVAIGMIYIDNYDEALESVEDVTRSILSAFIERTISQYFVNIDAIVRKLEKDKYLLIIRKSALQSLKEDKFHILEDVKAINIGNEVAVTLSIGIGIDGLSYAQNTEFARNAIDLALGRGGDQAVIKSGNAVTYYGGKSQQKETGTRVKARVKAQALAEIINVRDRVFVMGHRNADEDSFGAAVGIRTACVNMEKKCHIVLDSVSSSLQPLVDMYKSNPDLDKDAIVTSQEALELASGNTALVIVDVNKPSITECPDLIKKCKAVVVLDHHRQGTEVVENATLSYVEPYASSACEMVAEILTYINGGVKIKSVVADCLYAGIVIDTQNFVTKAGVRTFEAAAYLRRMGADATRIRKMLREDAGEYKAKADSVRRAEIYRQGFAISFTDPQGLKSPSIVAAQAANEMLNIKGIKASFVLVQYQGKIYISARSIDEVNVQIIMEKMGGGGHMNIAGAQLEEMSMEDAFLLLKETLDIMLDNGEI